MSKLLKTYLSPLKIFKKLNGNLDHMRQNAHSHKSRSIRETVSELGFNLMTTENNGAKFQRTFSGLAAYKAIHGDVKIVIDFVVPHDDARYPENTWGMKLGQNLTNIRCKGAWSEHRAQLEALGVNYEVKPVRPFEVIYCALESYKAIHDDVNVVRDFVVPHDDARYPENTWGMKLGRNLHSIRCNGAWSEHRVQLEALGVNYEIKPVRPFEVIYSALESYKAIHGDVNVAHDFVVPHGDARYPENTWGMKLGPAVRNIRCNGTWPEHRAQLEALGVNYEIKPVRRESFEVIYSALESYKAVHGNVDIVQDFVVPHGDIRYPENTWGMKLGRNLFGIRCQGTWSEHRAQLEALGVNYELINKHHGFEVIYSALKSYKAIHGDVHIVSDFTVPHGDARYRENTWGMKLGQNLMSIRCQGAWSEHRAQLETLGVNYEVKPMRNEPFEIIYSALESYKATHGDVSIVHDFVVPHGDARYPENTWGMNLGRNLFGIRCKGAWSEHRAQLEALGVNYEIKPMRREPFDVTYSAVESYKAIHGDINIVQDYVVPHGDARYPENTWGMKLGRNLHNIRCNGTWSERRAQLEALGVNYELINKHHGFEVIYSALKSYKAVHGHVNIVFDFVVPHGDARYPENTWGMKLGQNLSGIRCKGAWSEHRAQLEALGVNYDVKPVRPFEVIFSALESYKAIHGDVHIAQDFVVPHGDARYPENTWGMKLGRNLYNIRCQGAWSEHRAQLEALGVNFEVRPVRRESFEVIYSALECYKAIHGHVRMRQKFVVPHDARYPENSWGMNLGGTFYYIRCRGGFSKHRAQLSALGVFIRNKRLKRE